MKNITSEKPFRALHGRNLELGDKQQIAQNIILKVESGEHFTEKLTKREVSKYIVKVYERRAIYF